jgi:hypothetical protein
LKTKQTRMSMPSKVSLQVVLFLLCCLTIEM